VTTPTRLELKLQTRQREGGKPQCVFSFSTSFFFAFRISTPVSNLFFPAGVGFCLLACRLFGNNKNELYT
jgi:hypothetical protein